MITFAVPIEDAHRYRVGTVIKFGPPGERVSAIVTECVLRREIASITVEEES